VNFKDAQDLEAAYRRYSRGLFNYVLRHVGDHHRAEEILQEAFCRAYARRDTFHAGARISTWLYRIALNLCIDYLRARKHRLHASLEAPTGRGDGTRLSDTVPDPVADVFARASRDEQKEQVRQAIRNLPERERSVFLLRTYHEMTYGEIARITGLSTRTVQNCVRRSRDRVKAELQRAGVRREEVLES
jgi:RNA polymerase sigma-70 factor (ECF subfamily)